MKILYLAVEDDEHELPLFVSENREEMARKFGITANNLGTQITRSRVYKRKNKGVRFYKLEVEK